MLATKGYQVLGVDVSYPVVATIKAGEIHIVEPDLDIVVKSAVKSRKLTASLVPEKADAAPACAAACSSGVSRGL